MCITRLTCTDLFILHNVGLIWQACVGTPRVVLLKCFVSLFVCNSLQDPSYIPKRERRLERDGKMLNVNEGRLVLMHWLCTTVAVLYYEHSHLVTWDSIMYSSNICVVSVHNISGTIDKLVSQDLQPWAFRAFIDLAREFIWCKFRLHIVWIYKKWRFLKRITIFLEHWAQLSPSSVDDGVHRWGQKL